MIIGNIHHLQPWLPAALRERLRLTGVTQGNFQEALGNRQLMHCEDYRTLRICVIMVAPDPPIFCAMPMRAR